MTTEEMKVKIDELVAAGLPVEEAKKVVEAEAAKAAEKEEKENESENGSTGSTSTMSKYDRTVNDLIRGEGNLFYRNIKVKTAKVTEMTGYFMVNLTVNKELRAMVAEGDDFVEGTRNIVFSSNFALGGVIKNTDNIAWIGNSLVENAKVFEAIMAGATIDVVNQPVSAGEIYKNPFGTTNGEGTKFEHDTFINHIVAIRVNNETAEDIRDAKRSMIRDMFKTKLI